jgi:hypothetical protein
MVGVVAGILDPSRVRSVMADSSLGFACESDELEEDRLLSWVELTCTLRLFLGLCGDWFAVNWTIGFLVATGGLLPMLPMSMSNFPIFVNFWRSWGRNATYRQYMVD